VKYLFVSVKANVLIPKLHVFRVLYSMIGH